MSNPELVHGIRGKYSYGRRCAVKGEGRASSGSSAHLSFGIKKVPTHRIIQQALENRWEGSMIVKRFQVLSKPRSMN